MSVKQQLATFADNTREASTRIEALDELFQELLEYTRFYHRNTEKRK